MNVGSFNKLHELFESTANMEKRCFLIQGSKIKTESKVINVLIFQRTPNTSPKQYAHI